MSVPSVDEDAGSALEPGTAHPLQRLRAVRTLRDAGVNAGVLMAPVVPGFTTQPAKLVANPELRAQVEEWLEEELWSPVQISQRLRLEFPDDPMMRVCPETIYQALFVQGRGALRKELAVCLRTGRAVRRPSGK